MFGSWQSPLNESSDLNMLKKLKFDIVSSRIIEVKNEKKYVAYKVKVSSWDEEEDPNDAVVERRYNDFLSLYNILKKQYPSLVAGLNFPRKVLIGNFSPEHISTRSTGFIEFLTLICSQIQLRTSRPVAAFLQDRELLEATKLITKEQYSQARPIVENVFYIMNKLHTARSPTVLRVLCLLLCVSWLCRHPDSSSLASLALRRYQAVSDIDLLRYYVPLLHIAREICLLTGLDATEISSQLTQLKMSGVSVDPGPGLLNLLLEDLTPTKARSTY